ncbi:MAG TPA: AAA family ATPase [Mobilitalea sp.]|nr:AAA family ATPase [Mobilitalea sp.]
MKRTAIEHLLKWSQNEDVRPVILTGAKGVGKTYLACDFAKSFYKQFLYVNFEHDPLASELFKSKDPFKVSALLLENYSVNKTALSQEIFSEDRLLILDEIGHCPDALQMLTELQFTGEFPRIIAISSNPIKKEILDLYYHIPVYPLLFNEFLVAIAKDWYIETIITHFETDKKIPEIVHKELLSLFNLYLIIGGMPGIINEYLNFDNLLNITENHMLLMGTYKSYLNNISSDSEALKMNQVLGSIPLQLLKENKKFQYKLIRKGTTHAMYKEAIQNLADRNYIIPSYKATSNELSNLNTILEENRMNVNDITNFKLYLSDVGILNSLLTKQVKPPFNSHAAKALLENYVAETLQANGYPIIFWESDSTAKIDFIIPKDGHIIPVELFTDTNTRSKNLSILKQKIVFPYAIKISSKNFGYSKNVKYVPYYAVFCI